jgi:phosphohistidine phosphatase
LNERGYSDAYMLSNWYYTHHELPNLIVSSDATRALSTAMIFTRALGIPSERMLIEPKIYESTSSTLKKVIKNFDAAANCVMLFGHNPGITNLVNELSNDLFFDNIPTCGIISFQFDIKSWSDNLEKKGQIVFQQFPKEYKG